jgi:hypothetical protein
MHSHRMALLGMRRELDLAQRLLLLTVLLLGVSATTYTISTTPSNLWDTPDLTVVLGDTVQWNRTSGEGARLRALSVCADSKPRHAQRGIDQWLLRWA